VSKEQQYKPRLFTYPAFTKSCTIFDDDDLQQDGALLVLCVRAVDPDDEDADGGAEEHTMHIWKGHEFDGEGMLSEEDFVNKVI
jgi:hypothetical protein